MGFLAFCRTGLAAVGTILVGFVTSATVNYNVRIPAGQPEYHVISNGYADWWTAWAMVLFAAFLVCALLQALLHNDAWPFEAGEVAFWGFLLMFTLIHFWSHITGVMIVSLIVLLIVMLVVAVVCVLIHLFPEWTTGRRTTLEQWRDRTRRRLSGAGSAPSS